MFPTPGKFIVEVPGFFFLKINVSTPGKFYVHTLVSFDFLKKSMFIHRDFFLKNQCFHTRKIQRSHTGIFPLYTRKNQCPHTQRKSSRPRETQKKSMSFMGQKLSFVGKFSLIFLRNQLGKRTSKKNVAGHNLLWYATNEF